MQNSPRRTSRPFHASTQRSRLAVHLLPSPYAHAVHQETLRLLPIVAAVAREALADDVLPLAHPLQLTDGRTVAQLAVRTGQPVLLSLLAFNRDPAIWGADADVFRPARWFGDVPRVKSPGVYRGSMSFGAGVRACIGCVCTMSACMG